MKLTVKFDSYVLQARNRCLSLESQLGNGEAQGDSRMQTQIEPHYWPQVTGLELQQISRKYPLTLYLLSS